MAVIISAIYFIYANNSQQIANIADASYRVDRGANGTYQLGKQTGDDVTVRSEDYGYDANGNLIYVLKGNRKPDSTLQVINSRKLLWDEENRLLGINDNGFVSNYWYDASGERTVKQSYDNEGVQVNGAQSAARTGTANFTAYVSPYLVVRNGGEYTKHIYMGSQRITSKVSNSGIFTVSPVKDTLQAKYATLTTKIKERFDTLGVTYNGVAKTGGLTSLIPLQGQGVYFYHSDHLGSSSLITDITGALVQHVEYVPFGETFIDERRSASSWTTPYLFNAKERDEETGLYYYHARYYDSKRSVWLSVDPLAEKYPNIGSYVYCFNSPVKFIDPDGRNPIFKWLLKKGWKYFVAGVAVSGTAQFAANYMASEDLNKSFNEIDILDVFISGGINTVTGGGGSIRTLFKEGSRLAVTKGFTIVTLELISATTDLNFSGSGFETFFNGNKNAYDVVSSLVLSFSAGMSADKIADVLKGWAKADLDPKIFATLTNHNSPLEKK